MREDITSKPFTEIKLENYIENIFIEIILRSKKMSIRQDYNLKLRHMKNHSKEIGKGIEYYSSKYEHFVLSDFNA